MFNQTYLELLACLLEWDCELFCPWKEGSGNTKLSKFFRACFISPLILTLIMTSFVYYEWDTVSFIAVAENLAIALGVFRSFGYAILMKIFYDGYTKLIGKLLHDRRSIPSAPEEDSLTGRCCKIEFILSVAGHVTTYCIIFVLLHAFVYLSPNEYQLPFKCYIIFLPPDGFMFAWELNYLILTVTATLPAFCLASFVSLPFVMMNHSCWLIDLALMTAAKINKDLQAADDIFDPGKIAKTTENLKQFNERCEKFIEWQNEVQDLLVWYFNLEFQIQTLILCLCIYVLSSTLAGGIILLVFAFCVTQIFILCWMGTRVTTRIDKLSFEVCRNWYLMPPAQRKTLQMILHWTQNMKGFSGLFKNVNLETCKEIFEAAYSFYAFLKSTSGN